MRSSQQQRQQQRLFPGFATASDDEFRSTLKQLLEENPLFKDYPQLFEKAPDCFVQWRKRYAKSNPKLWRRIFNTERVLKEFFEAVPVLDAVVKLIENDTRLNQNNQQNNQENQQQQYTIIDLCSGKGYLGMILSEMLPPSKVFRIVLMDKAWPMRNAPVKPQHINWEHIYGTFEDENGKNEGTISNNNNLTSTEVAALENIHGEEKHESDDDLPCGVDTNNTKESPKPSLRSYYDTWPIPIDTSKQNLKSSRQLQLIKNHYLSNPSQHPVILLAIHLCGTLSLKAIELFNTNPSVKFLALKPCCLPGMIHAKRHEIFRVGNHCFEASEVCIHGKWKKNKWENGPPRSHIKPRFQKWSSHLYQGIGYGYGEDLGSQIMEGQTSEPTTSGDEKVRKAHAKIVVQHSGGFQNDFLFAERMPVSSATFWDALNQRSTEEQ